MSNRIEGTASGPGTASVNESGITAGSATTALERQLLARLTVELNGPLRSSLNALSLAANVVAADEGGLRPHGQEALHILCQEVDWHQSLWIHVLASLDAIAHAQQPPPLPARSGGR